MVKFMKQINIKIMSLGQKYKRIVGLYPGVLQSAGFNTDEINYYFYNKNLGYKRKK